MAGDSRWVRSGNELRREVRTRDPGAREDSAAGGARYRPALQDDLDIIEEHLASLPEPIRTIVRAVFSWTDSLVIP